MAVPSFPFLTLSRRGRVFLLMTLGGLAAGLDRDGLVAAVGGVRDFLRMPNDDLEIAYDALTFGFFLSLIGGGFFAEWLGAKRAFTICGAVWCCSAWRWGSRSGR